MVKVINVWKENIRKLKEIKICKWENLNLYLENLLFGLTFLLFLKSFYYFSSWQCIVYLDSIGFGFGKWVFTLQFKICNFTKKNGRIWDKYTLNTVHTANFRTSSLIAELLQFATLSHILSKPSLKNQFA